MQASTTEVINNKSSSGGYLKYLPKDPQQRTQLKEAIQNSLNKWKRKFEKKPQPAIEERIKTLQLRILMIDSCAQMSLLRLDHLQWIFKHYCIHIFKTGKHMTFERLQYEKVHLTMERFFLFLKDFQLTMMKVGDKKEQVVDKNTIILLFKKMSSTCRDLSFEQFIRCIQKLAIVYYDQKLIYHQKKQKLRQQKQKRKQDYERKKQQRLKKSEVKQVEKKEGQGQQEGQQNLENNQQNNEKQQKQQGEENDELIKDLMNNKELEDPNEQINKITNRYALEDEQGGQSPEGEIKNTNFSQMDDETLLLLTNEEKIQYYYKFMVKVDSVKDYRDKLTALNLPIFQKGKSVAKQANNSSEKNVKTSQDQNARMEELKKKMDEKKLKQKASPIPKPKEDGAWLKAEQQKRKKRELKKQREQKAKEKNKVESDALIQKKLDSQKSAKQKKPDYNEKQIDWNTLGKMSIDQLKMNKFNPNRYFSKDDDDKIFLDEYEGGRARISSGMDARERNSMSVVEDVKKRVGEVEKKQKKQEKDLQKKLGQNVPIKARF